jgi:D-amino peptidase
MMKMNEHGKLNRSATISPMTKKDDSMNILIAVDMEGISGVVHWDHVSPEHTEYERFRRIMTADVNAAVRGVAKAGADQIQVADGHAHSRNLLIEDLDVRARLNQGGPTPYSMVQGIHDRVDAVILIGYHARAGTENAILDHTWSSKRVMNVWLNDQPIGEIGLNAALCGHYGAPVIMISGDHSACAEASDLLGQIETVVVKNANGRMAADCLPPKIAQSEIEAAAERAIINLAAGSAATPLRLGTPITVKVELTSSEMADRAAWLPGAQRQGRTIYYTAEDMPMIYRAFRTIISLATEG